MAGKSSEAKLRKLRLKGAQLTTKFRANKRSYRAVADKNRKSCKLAVVTKHRKAKVKVDGRKWNTKGKFRKVKLKKSKTRVRIVVTAEDGSRKSYRVTVRKKK